MDLWTLLPIVAAGMAVAALVTWAVLRPQLALWRERAARLDEELGHKRALQEENERLKIRVAELGKEREAETSKVGWVDDAEDKLREAFSALAASALQNNNTQFLQQSRDQFDNLLKQVKGDWGTQRQELKGLVDPLEKTLDKLELQIRELEQKREGAYHGLVQQVQQLGQAHQDLRSATSDLAQALKSSGAVRGRWGELQLRRIAELAGMVAHVDFEEQASGDQGRPDMIVHLPNEGVLPVDAKVPLEAYLAAVEEKDERRAERKLAEHARAVRSHMRALGQRAYQSQFARTPDFVVMVVPYESGLAAAFRVDGRLLEDALDHKVLIVSPVTLFALLKAVAFGWLQWTLSENAKQIALQGQELYERLRVFAGHVGNVGRKLGSTVDAYNAVVGSMEHRVFPAAGRLKEMGAGSDDLPRAAAVESRPRVLQGVGEDPDAEA